MWAGTRRTGYFYYVMEAADDVKRGREIDPRDYTPRTLGSELTKRGRLSAEECVRLGMSLVDALGQLHQCGLIHRDIKPSNIIFIGNIPKLADIGLVTTIGEAKSFVGTENYVPREGPSGPSGDLYSLGKVLYQACMGKDAADFPELPTDLDQASDGPCLMRINEIILQACHPDPRKRFTSAKAMFDRLGELLDQEESPSVTPGASAPTPTTERTYRWSAVILSKGNVAADDEVLALLRRELPRHGCAVAPEAHRAVGVEWARQIEERIREADAVVILLSASSVQSEMMACEVEIAHEAVEQLGKPQLIPVRVQFEGPLPAALGRVLNPVRSLAWEAPEDDQRLVKDLIRTLECSKEDVETVPAPFLEQEGGAVPLDSVFYLVRPADHEFRAAIARRDSIVLVQGARQMGKTSLLARGLQQAREQGASCVHADLQELNASAFDSLEKFYVALGDLLAERLGLEVLPAEVWQERSSPNMNFDRYLRREVLGGLEAHLVWGLDEVDRLFAYNFGGEVFGMFRSWHNKRALDPKGPWNRLTLAIAYATEAHLFISDLNHSPFNVGTRLTLDDFDRDQVWELNRRYGTPLKDELELARLMRLVHGQPFLVRRSLHELAAQNISLGDLENQADRDEGIFGDHLRRILVALAKDKALLEVVRRLLRGNHCIAPESFYRLRSAGVLSGESEKSARLRCQVYTHFLQRHLL